MHGGEDNISRAASQALQRLEKLHQLGPPLPAFALTFADDLAMLKGLVLHLKINLGVDVGRIERDMAEPSTNGIDVDPRPQEVDRCRMPDPVDTHRFAS